VAAGDGLKGANRDAFLAMREFFKDAGFNEQDISSLSSAITEYLQQGYSQDTIALLLNETDAYRRRFGAVNEQRKQRGLSVLKPGEIVQLENTYRTMFRQYGLPAGMFDSNEDFVKYIGGDVSPQEMQSRLDIARATVISDDPIIRDTYRAWYAAGLNEGDALAAVLNPERALPEIERKARSAMLGGAANRQGVSVTQARAEELAAMGVDPNSAQQGFGKVADIQRNAGAIANRYGLAYEGQRDAEDAVFLNDAQSIERLRRLGQREAAEFGGRGIGDSRSLGSRNY
jgi:hypothetical protein